MLQLSIRPLPFVALLLAMTVYMGHMVPHAQLEHARATRLVQPQQIARPVMVAADLHAEQAAPAEQIR